MKLTKHMSMVLSKDATNGVIADQLAKINRFALTPLTAEQVYVRKAILANNAIDRDNERFPDGMLQQFQNTLPGKSFLIGHQRGDYGVGLWFDASIEEMPLDQAKAVTGEDLRLPDGMTTVKNLVGYFYMVKKLELEGMIADIEGGVMRFVSIGFNADRRQPITDSNGNTLYYEYAGKGEAQEGSVVWLGAQRGAIITKSAKDGVDIEGEANNKTGGNKTMKSIVKRLGLGEDATEDQALQKIIQMETRLKTVEGIVAPLGENATKESVEALVKAAGDGNVYRKDLVDRQVKFERLLGRVADTDADVAVRSKQLATRDIAEIKADSVLLEKLVREKFPNDSSIKGEDPNRDRDGKNMKTGDDVKDKSLSLIP